MPGSGLKIEKRVWAFLTQRGVSINEAVEKGLKILARNPSLALRLAKEMPRGEQQFTRASISQEADYVAEQLAGALGLSKHAVYAIAAYAYAKYLSQIV